MYSVVVEKECGCFKRSSMPASQEFATKEEALQEAQAMCEDMNETFCQKHIFSIVEDQEQIVIKMDIRD